MKGNNKKRLIFLIVTMALIMSCFMIFATADTGDKIDAMTEIEANLSRYKVGETVSVAKDGYIGIPVEVSVYHGGGEIITGKAIDATPIAIYVVNTAVERIGTDSDVNIISSMLERGYIVVIFDYLNNDLAKSPDLDWSVQKLRANVKNGTYLTGAGLPSGAYNNNMVVPAGYNVEFNHIFWEIDKHGADGTLERIVEVWNNDFRAKKKDVIVKWVDESGNRKATQNGHDESEPVWLDADGTENAEGQYIRVKHTKAEKIEDCVNKDGTPIDLNLYMHITYPTLPTSNVPVMVLSNSSEHLASGTQTADRPHLSGFLFNGYAGVAFDHGYVPMARDDHYGYFDGDDSDSITGDNATYSIHNFNNGRIDTAAVRYIRYLSASEHDKYTFDNTAIGVYGNSKGGWATMLGEENPDISFARRIYAGCNGKSRYENGKTEDIVFGSYTIDGGEEQPWLTYNGVALDSGADLTYMSCGWGPYCITSSHSPTFISCNIGDGSYTGESNKYVNACRTADVVSMWFEVDQGHTFASGIDRLYGVSTYQAFMDFSGYHLKGDAVKVAYASRLADNYSGMPSNAPVVVKFTGSVSADEVLKITLKNSKGEAVMGSWTSQYGNTEWTFTTPTLECDEEYVLTVPKGIKGDNGKEMIEDYTYSFRNGKEKASEISSVTTDIGTYLYFTKPDEASVEEFEIELYNLRLYVSNDAVNKLQVYALSDFNASSPDSATVGALVGTAAVSGIGQYDVNVTDYVNAIKSGTQVAFLVKQLNEADEVVVHSSPLVSTLGSCVKGNKVSTTLTAAPDGTKSLKIHKFSSSTWYPNDQFYQNFAVLFTNSEIIKSGELVEEDIGRTFRISFRIYDTTSRIISVQMASLSTYSVLFPDYNVSYYNVYTKAGEWVEVSFDHTVYEPLYADKVGYKTQKLTVYAPLEGSEMNPIYLSDVKSCEIFTDVTLEKAELLLGTTDQRVNPLATEYGMIPEKYADAATYPFVIFDENKNCISATSSFHGSNGSGGAMGVVKDYVKNAYKDGSYATGKTAYVLMRRDYTFTTTEYYNNLAQIQGTAYIDLGGHTLSAGSTAKPMLAISSKGYSGAAGEKVFPTSLIFSNGTMLANNHGIMTLSTWDSVGDGSIVNKDFNLTFNGVTFGITSTSTSAELMTLVSNPSATSVAAPFNLTYNDCTFDLRTVAPKSTISIFTTVTEGKYVKITTAINGGKILTDNPELVTVLETGTNNYGSSVNFGKGSDSEYVKYVVPEGKTVGADTYLSGGVKLHFVKGATTDGYTVYELEEAPLTSDEFTTPYGVIPEKYSSVTSYPFVIFDGNKNCIGAHANLLDITSSYDNAGALHIAKNYLSKNNYWDGESYGSSPATAYIVMRRDYTMASTEQYNNIAQVQGLITIDLNGFTLTADQSRTLFPATSKQWSGSGDADYFHASQFKFTNGSIVAYDKAIVTYSCTCTELKTFDISFEDIDFKALGTAQSFILDYASSGKTSYPNISFSNCTFDITESKATGSVILFNLGKSLMQANFTVSGCSVIAGDTDFTLFLKPSDVNGTLTFSKGDNGKYLEIKVNSDVAPEGTFNNGELGFVQTNGDGDTFVYTLAPVGLNSFVPKASITLGSELVYNIYVPVVDFLKSFTVDGVSYEDLIPVTLDNGISYYRIEVPMGASEAARNIVLEAVLTVGDNEHVGTWTMSIPKYAKKVVESDTTGVEIDLVKDVLSYIRAAYAYFDKTDEEKMALIDSILGENYDTSNAPVLNGSSIAPSEGLKSVTYILNARPTVRFHITGEADSYAFYVDGTELKTTVGSDDSGTYIDTDIYAYAMAETITYTIDGVESGSYHINSYYTFVTTDEEHRDDAELINLVLRFAKYCESAAEYRKFVRGDYGSMTITAPSEIYSNYPAKDLNISFSGADYNGTVTYTTDNENVFVENGKIYATGTFASEVTVTVTAKTRYHVATATVKVSTYNGSISAETKIQYYEENIIKEENKGGMIFVGDSYVDGYKMEAPPFWRDFYRDFAGEKAFLMGLSSSQIHQLEIASERIVYPMEPSEIVVNIGHNDLHHGSLTVDQFVERLTALFYEYHERLPEAKIYFISVAPKKIAETNADRFVSSFEKVPAANAAIKALAEQYDWLYYVDTTDIFYSYGENLVNTNMFPGNDNSHPSLVAYDLMKIALDEVRGVTRSDVAYIDNDLRAITYTDKDGKNITGDFAASGKLVITQYVPGSNVYVHFRLHQSYRFVLWDSNGDGKHGAGYLGGGTVKDTTSGVTLYDGKEGLVLNWAVITKTEGDIHKAYWYINGQLMHTFESYTPAYFLIGGENANSLVYDVELSVKADNEAAYNEHVARYADDVINLETYGYGPLTNKVLTDEGGSTLTDNYIIKGKLNISDFPKDNTYIQFVVGSGNRFLLWDSNNDSKLGAGYTENGTNYSDKSDGITLYDAKEGLTLDWAIVVNGDVASFYLNGELIKELTVTERSEFKVGASQMNVTLSDIEIYTQATDETAYNNALSEYIG